MATTTKSRARILATALGLLVLLSTTAAFAQHSETLQSRAPVVDETFESLENWEPLRFRGIDRLTHYEAVREGGKPLLLVESDDSGSGIVHERIFNVYDYPALEWQWRVENIVRSGDLATRAGDNFAIRVYVLFEYDPSKVGPATRVLYSAMRAFYGEYPPFRSLVYVWGNLQREQRWYPNANTSRAMMLPVDQGEAHLLQWRDHTRNLIEDYYEAFGDEPPENARVAVMGDTDGSGERTRAWIEYIRVGAADAKYQVGGRGPAGGVVFLVSANEAGGRRYVEAAPEDIKGFVDPDTAAELAREYRGSGFSDWRLPTYRELNEMYTHRDLIDGLSADWYWSSSREPAYGVRYQHLGHGSQGYSRYELFNYRVRPVREFSYLPADRPNRKP